MTETIQSISLFIIYRIWDAIFYGFLVGIFLAVVVHTYDLFTWFGYE